MADLLGASKQLIPFTTSLDKLDKIGREGVEKELVEKGFDSTAMKTLSPFFEIRGTASEKLERLQEILRSSPQGLEGVEELQFIVKQIESLSFNNTIDLEVTLARGLNYYTGLCRKH